MESTKNTPESNFERKRGFENFPKFQKKSENCYIYIYIYMAQGPLPISILNFWRSKIKSKKILAPVFQGESVGRHRKIVRSLFRQYPCLQLFPSCTCVHSTHVVGLNHNLVQPHHMCCGDTTCAVGTSADLGGGTPIYIYIYIYNNNIYIYSNFRNFSIFF